MKKLGVVGLLAVVGIVFVMTSWTHAQQKAPYVVGVVLDLTGIISNIGIAERRGLDIAIDAVNAAGGVHGRQLKTIVYDGETTPAKSVLHSKRLIDVDKAVACLGYSSSGGTMAAIQTVEAGKTAMIGGGASEKIWIPTKPWVFSVVPRQREASIPMLIEVLNKKVPRRLPTSTSIMFTGRPARRPGTGRSKR